MYKATSNWSGVFQADLTVDSSWYEVGDALFEKNGNS